MPGIWEFWLAELGQISSIFSHMSQFFAEIWQKNRQNLPKKSWLAELSLADLYVHDCKFFRENKLKDSGTRVDAPMPKVLGIV